MKQVEEKRDRWKPFGQSLVKLLTMGLSLFMLFMLASQVFSEGHINFWPKLFSGPIEVIYIIMKDGASLKRNIEVYILNYDKVCQR